MAMGFAFNHFGKQPELITPDFQAARLEGQEFLFCPADTNNYRKEPEERMFKKILIATDGSDVAKRACLSVFGLAAKAEAEVHLISIIEAMPRYASSVSEVKMIEERERERLAAIHQVAELEAARRGLELHTKILRGHEANTIVEFVQKGGFDLLVFGYHGLSSKGKTRLGATARALVEDAPCSVLMVR
jgi:nucleotide-binding universal stress UspA family protein